MPTTIDPICGMNVIEEVAEDDGLMVEFQGQNYYFCSPECKEEFQKDPEKALMAGHARQAGGGDMPPRSEQ